MKVYKIRNAQGLYSSGGTSPRWTRMGKTWTQLNHLNGHLSLLRKERARYQERMSNPITYGIWREHVLSNGKLNDPYEGCVVVEFEMQTVKETGLVGGSLA